MNLVRLTDQGTPGSVTAVFQNKVFALNLPVARAGDTFTHPIDGPNPIPVPTRAIKTYVVGLPAIRVGDSTGNVGPFVTGAVNVFLNA